jgi:hypothetical protein
VPHIEFLYDRACPNVAAARAALRIALAHAGLPVTWQEWERADPAAPAHARRYGSPTILIDGTDLIDEPPSDAPSCRLYPDGRGGHAGVPSAMLIRAALGRLAATPGHRPPAV